MASYSACSVLGDALDHSFWLSIHASEFPPLLIPLFEASPLVADCGAAGASGRQYSREGRVRLYDAAVISRALPQSAKLKSPCVCAVPISAVASRRSNRVRLGDWARVSRWRQPGFCSAKIC